MNNQKFKMYYECIFVVKENPVKLNGRLHKLPVGMNRLCVFLESLKNIEDVMDRNDYVELRIKPVEK